jgi:hypothetical protein
MTTTQWQYLEQRPHLWRKQLYIKGRRLTAFGVWSDMTINNETPSQAADNWDLPLGAINEVIRLIRNINSVSKKW